jgi:hypothetical protein
MNTSREGKLTGVAQRLVSINVLEIFFRGQIWHFDI